MKNKYSVNDNFFNSIDNQDKAWLLGLLYADGCVYENGNIKIDLAITDKEILIKIKDLIDCNYQIKIYDNKLKTFNTDNKIYKCKPQCRLQWRSKQMVEDLKRLGCFPSKTYDLTFPTEDIVPKEFIKDFIRGYLDGDGGISYWVDNQNTGHKKFSIHFCGTTEMMYGIANLLSNKFNCNPDIRARHEDRDNNNKQILIDGNRVVYQILNWLYQDSNIYMLRKYNKYLELQEEIKRTDNDKTLYGFLKPRRKVIKLDDLTIYESCADCSRKNNISKSMVTISCQSKNNFMYLDDYNKETENGTR